MAQPKRPVLGYDDTPFLPDGRWRVHDSERPQPRVVAPGATVGAPPFDAELLFDGSDLARWRAVAGGDAGWQVRDGYMEVVPGTGNIETRDHFGDCQLHLEFACPAQVEGSSQGRGNSGVFLLGLYEIQVLDGYDNRTYADGHTGAIYGQFPPLVNACRLPGEWQSYDIVFESARFDGARLVSPAYLTVLHNGLLIHHRQAAIGPTGNRILADYGTPHPPMGPLRLQDHRNPTRFRNIWLRPLTPYDAA